MNIGPYSYEEYLHVVKSFHGNPAPGLVIGGFMVDLCQKNLPEGEFFDAICETPVCLPDAVQLLTPCTFGNGWLKVFDFGRFALSLYEKYSGNGIRVYIDTEKLESWPEIKGWFFKLKSKKDQDIDRLMCQIKEAGSGISTLQRVHVQPDKLRRPRLGAIGICGHCGEAFPTRDGQICRACQGESPYVIISS